MWIILLSILKGIGIFILIILGIILLLLGMVLFVPIRYGINGAWEEEKTVVGKATWLLGFVKFDVLYQEQLKIIGRVLGIKVYDNLEPVKKKKKSSKKTKRQKVKKKEKLTKVQKSSNEKKSSEYNNHKKNTVIKNENRQNKVIVREVEKPPIKEMNSEAKRVNGEAVNKSDNLIDKLKNIYKKLRCKVVSIYDKIKHILKNINDYYELFQKRETLEALLHCKKRIFTVIRHILPRKWEVIAELGFEDPATLGKVYEVMGMLYPLLGNHIYIIPQWEQEIILVKGKAKGRITIFVLIYSVIKLAVDKNVSNLIKVIRKGGKINGRK